MTPLHGAAGRGNTVAIRLLLAAGAEVNAKTDDGETPLHGATRRGQAEAIRILLAAGAEVNARTAEGRTALDRALNDKCREPLRTAGGKTGAELDAAQPVPPSE